MSFKDTSPALLQPSEVSPARSPFKRKTRCRKLEFDAPCPLGPKARTRHTRRQRHMLVQCADHALPHQRPNGLRMASPDGTLAFTLKRTPTGLCVERTQHRPLHTRLVLSLVFTQGDSFQRWCDAESVRFDHPVLFSFLRSEGHGILQNKR